MNEYKKGAHQEPKVGNHIESIKNRRFFYPSRYLLKIKMVNLEKLHSLTKFLVLFIMPILFSPMVCAFPNNKSLHGPDIGLPCISMKEISGLSGDPTSCLGVCMEPMALRQPSRVRITSDMLVRVRAEITQLLLSELFPVISD